MTSHIAAMRAVFSIAWSKSPSASLHFLRAFQIKLLGVFQPALIGDQPAHADAAEHVVGVVIVFLQEMHVVGRHQPDAQPLGQIGQLGIDHVLLVDAVLLHLDEKPIRPENLQIGLGDLLAQLWRRA